MQIPQVGSSSKSFCLTANVKSLGSPAFVDMIGRAGETRMLAGRGHQNEKPRLLIRTRSGCAGAGGMRECAGPDPSADGSICTNEVAQVVAAFPTSVPDITHVYIESGAGHKGECEPA